MKKAFAIFMLMALCLGLCACGGQNGDEPAVRPNDSTTEPTSTPAATPAVTQAPQLDEVFQPDMSTLPSEAAGDPGQVLSAPAATPIPTAAPAAEFAEAAVTGQAESSPSTGRVYATKSPTSELVIQGGSAQFVAYAQNSTSVKWFMASPDGGIVITAAEMPGYFPGLWVSGSSSTCLTLGNIPTSLSGWKVQARFEGNGGPVHTNTATVWCVTAEEAAANGMVPSSWGQYSPWPNGGGSTAPYPGVFYPSVFR